MSKRFANATNTFTTHGVSDHKMNEVPTPDVQDFSSLTCTNLMIKLKILLKNLKSGQSIQFYSTREQSDTISPLGKNKEYIFEKQMLEPNKFLISFKKS